MLMGLDIVVYTGYISMPTLQTSAWRLWMRSSCSLRAAAAALAADPMEGVLLARVWILSSSAAAFFSGSTYSAHTR